MKNNQPSQHQSLSHQPVGDRPIGIFDSGVGGLSVLQHIHQLLPHENLLYIADSGHAPYGCKEGAYVEQRSRIITEYLLAQGAKVIVIACNTATASIIEKFRQQYGIPFIGVEPGIKPALALTKNHKIGVMATTGTLSSERYKELSQRFSDSANIYHQACPGLADQVEAGLTETPETIVLLKKYLSLLTAEQVDTIVLGCTHYSFLVSPIQAIINHSIKLVDTSRAIAEQLIRVLEFESLKKKSEGGSVLYFTTGSIHNAEVLMSCLLKKKLTVNALP